MGRSGYTTIQLHYRVVRGRSRLIPDPDNVENIKRSFNFGISVTFSHFLSEMTGGVKSPSRSKSEGTPVKCFQRQLKRG